MWTDETPGDSNFLYESCGFTVVLGGFEQPIAGEMVHNTISL